MHKQVLIQCAHGLCTYARSIRATIAVLVDGAVCYKSALVFSTLVIKKISVIGKEDRSTFGQMGLLSHALLAIPLVTLRKNLDGLLAAYIWPVVCFLFYVFSNAVVV